MQTTIHHPFTHLLSAAILLSFTPLASAQDFQASSLTFLQNGVPEAPKTAAEKLQNLLLRQEQAFAALSLNLNQLPTNPALLGTKALFTQIDESTREMKSIHASCASLMATLRSEVKTIANSSSFTDEQKQELATSAETLAAECVGLTGKLNLAVKRLGAAYTILPRWNKIYKAYASLQSHTKAAEKIKTLVDEYLKSFAPEPETPANHPDSAEQP